MLNQFSKKIENRYWEGNGKHHKEYLEMREAQFEFTKTTNAVFHRYYRFYNDGDAPASIRVAIQRHGFGVAAKFDYVAEYLEKIETAVDERVVAEYKRFQKMQNGKVS